MVLLLLFVVLLVVFGLSDKTRNIFIISWLFFNNVINISLVIIMFSSVDMISFSRLGDWMGEEAIDDESTM